MIRLLLQMPMYPRPGQRKTNLRHRRLETGLALAAPGLSELLKPAGSVESRKTSSDRWNFGCDATRPVRSGHGRDIGLERHPVSTVGAGDLQ